MNRSIGLLGCGFVGQILKKYYPQATMYDINGKYDKLADVLNQDVIFIAFNLKDNGLQSIDEVEDYMAEAPQGRIFIIKSTFVPKSTDFLQGKFPQHNIVYSPEFLTEATAWEDFTHPQFQILGMPHSTLHLSKEIFDMLPYAPVKRIISPLDAEMYKHAQNAYYGLKVVWFNQLYDACSQIGADYATLREILVQNPYIGDSHSMVFHKGYRGYGTQEVSKCIPKDLDALRKVAHMPLLDKVAELNTELWSTH